MCEINENPESKMNPGEIIEFIENDDYYHAQLCLNGFLCQGEVRNIWLFRYLLKKTNPCNYTLLLLLILCNVRRNKVCAVFINQDESIVSNIWDYVDFSMLLSELNLKHKANGLGAMLGALQCEIDYDVLFPEIARKDVLIMLGTRTTLNQYIEEFIGDDGDTLIQFLEEHMLNFPPKAMAEKLVNIICFGPGSREKVFELLMELYDYNHMQILGGISINHIIDLLTYVPNRDIDIVREIVKKCTKAAYQPLPLKRRMYVRNEEKLMQNMQYVDQLVENHVSEDRIIFLYMNTIMKNHIELDYLIEYLTDKGCDRYRIIDAVRDYWLVGRIKHVQDDGCVRVATKSITTSRLMVFDSKRIHITGVDKEMVEPKKGEMIYYKVIDYLDGGLFKIHYPCESIEGETRLIMEDREGVEDKEL